MLHQAKNEGLYSSLQWKEEKKKKKSKPQSELHLSFSW